MRAGQSKVTSKWRSNECQNHFCSFNLLSVTKCLQLNQINVQDTFNIHESFPARELNTKRFFVTEVLKLMSNLQITYKC